MAIDWSDNQIRKAFREELQKIFPSEPELEMFIDEELNEHLSDVAGGDNLSITAYKLLKWAKAKDKLDQLFKAFQKLYPDSQFVKQNSPLFVVAEEKISADEWNELFDCIHHGDKVHLGLAFLSAFRRLKRDFLKERPEEDVPTENKKIQEYLELYDDPELAYCFVEELTSAIETSEPGRDLTDFLIWKDRMVANHSFNVDDLRLIEIQEQQGYLSVAIRSSGRGTKKDGPDVTVWPELYIENEPESLEFNSSMITCPLKDVAHYLSDWIGKAETALKPFKCSQITVEIFLPCVHLEEDVSVWKIKTLQQRERTMGKAIKYVVRSTDRAENSTLRDRVNTKWGQLKALGRNSEVIENTYIPEICPDVGDLIGSLDEKLILHLAIDLPIDPTKRIEIYYDIIASAVPIAMWSFGCAESSVEERKSSFKDLCTLNHLSCLATFSRHWIASRAEPNSTVAKKMKLLCDCPDRWPNFPDLDDDEDLLTSM